MKNNQKGFIVPLIIIIAVVLIVGGGIYYHSQKNAFYNYRAGDTNAKSSDLKTYTNSQYAFSMEYPASWSIASQPTDGGYGGKFSIKLSFDGADVPHTSMTVNIEKDTNTTLEQIISKHYPNQESKLSIDGVPALKVVSTQASVGTYSSKDQTYTGQIPAKNLIVYVIKNGTLFTFNYIADNATFDTREPDIEAVITSLKFK